MPEGAVKTLSAKQPAPFRVSSLLVCFSVALAAWALACTIDNDLDGPDQVIPERGGDAGTTTGDAGGSEPDARADDTSTPPADVIPDGSGEGSGERLWRGIRRRIR